MNTARSHNNLFCNVYEIVYKNIEEFIAIYKTTMPIYSQLRYFVGDKYQSHIKDSMRKAISPEQLTVKLIEKVVEPLMLGVKDKTHMKEVIFKQISANNILGSIKTKLK